MIGLAAAVVFGITVVALLAEPAYFWAICASAGIVEASLFLIWYAPKGRR